VSLLRFLGVGGQSRQERNQARERGDTETVRRIAAQLERLEPEQAKYLAAFSYVLARVAHADLEFAETEVDEMLRIVRSLAHLSESEAALVVEIAKSQAQLLGGTENYVVTREFREVSSKEQRAELIECAYAVAAADGTISGAESAEIARIAEELGFTRPEAIALRSGWKDKLSEFQNR